MQQTDVARRLAETARSVAVEREPEAKQQQLLSAAVELVDSCTSAGLTIIHADRRVTTVAATGDTPREADELQYALGEGPCIDAVRTEPMVHSYDLAVDDRWPRWAPAAMTRFGARSMLCLRLWTSRDDIGALNLYSTGPGGFDHDEREAALLVAAHAAVALSALQDVDRLLDAMTRRTTIGVAIGLVMERYDLDREAAFETLRRLSQERNQKLHELAAHIAAGASLKGAARRGRAAGAGR